MGGSARTRRCRGRRLSDRRRVRRHSRCRWRWRWRRCCGVPEHIVASELLRDLHPQRAGRPHPAAGRKIVLETRDRVHGGRQILYLVLAVRQPEERLVLVRLPGIGHRGLQLVDRVLPLLVGDVVLRAREPLRVRCGRGRGDRCGTASVTKITSITDFNGAATARNLRIVIPPSDSRRAHDLHLHHEVPLRNQPLHAPERCRVGVSLIDVSSSTVSRSRITCAMFERPCPGRRGDRAAYPRAACRRARARTASPWRSCARGPARPVRGPRASTARSAARSARRRRAPTTQSAVDPGAAPGSLGPATSGAGGTGLSRAIMRPPVATRRSMAAIATAVAPTTVSTNGPRAVAGSPSRPAGLLDVPPSGALDPARLVQASAETRPVACRRRVDALTLGERPAHETELAQRLAALGTFDEVRFHMVSLSDLELVVEIQLDRWRMETIAGHQLRPPARHVRGGQGMPQAVAPRRAAVASRCPRPGRALRRSRSTSDLRGVAS